jgi:type II secretory pathway component PulF
LYREIGCTLNRRRIANPAERVGEESNRLDEVFDNLGEQYTKKSEFSLKTFGAAIEPVLIVVIAAIVAVILLAMYLPIFEFSAGI